MFGPPPPLTQGQKVQTATCAVVEHEGRAFLLSAAHVLLEAVRTVESDPRTDVVVGPVLLKLERSSVSYADERIVDVATLPLTRQQVQTIEQADYRVIHPPEWPLATVQPNDSIIMAGYPGSWRLQVSVNEHDFRAATLGLIVESVHAGEIIANRDPAFADPVSIDLEDVPPLGVGGCSGGPVFLVRDGLILVPRLCGVVKEGWTAFDSEHIILRFARLDVILGADGSVRAP